MWYDYLILTLLIIILLILIESYICFRMTFHSPKRKKLKEGEYDLPPGKEYEPFYERMKLWIYEMRSLPHEDVEIKSYD